MATTKEFRCVPKGAGGTLVVSNNKGDVQRIGTLGCDQSLGVIFKVDAQHTFCAHMCVMDTSKPISETQGIELRDQVYHKLNDLAKEEQWAVDDENFGVAMMTQCKRPTSKDLEGEYLKGSGWWMVQGVKKFMEQCLIELVEIYRARPKTSEMELLKMRRCGLKISEFDEETKRLEQQSQLFSVWVEDIKAKQDGAGFIVDPDPELKVTLLERDDGRALDLATGEVDTSSYVPREETLEAGQWSFPLGANHPLELAHRPLMEASRPSKGSKRSSSAARRR
jgi:hypothetical protein